MHKLAIIPARAGSVRIPNKNIKRLSRKPVIAYPVISAVESNLFDEVMVSTDSHEIAEVSKRYGATVPFYRSKQNSGEYATIADVLYEVLTNFLSIGRHFESVCCLFPAAALVSKERLVDSCKIFEQKGYSSLVPVIRFAYPVQRALRVKDGLLEFREPENIMVRSQDLEPLFHDSGQFYWIRTESLLKDRTIFTQNTGYIELSEMEAQDVDNLSDWDLLELKFRNLKNKNK